MKNYFGILFTTLFCFLCITFVGAQSEEVVQKAFEGKLAISHVEMPAHKTGFSVYPDWDEPIDAKEYGKMLKRYGFSVYAGDTVIVKEIKVKRKHIEVHLTNFDPNRESSKNYKYEKRMLKSGVMTKSEYERMIRKQQMNTNGRRAVKDLEYYNGSRITIKLDRKVRPEDLTVEAISDYLAAYITLIGTE